MEIAVFCDVPNALSIPPSVPFSAVICLFMFVWVFWGVITYTNMENRKPLILSTWAIVAGLIKIW